jgi:methyl-accepting chemotaxis protein
MINATPRLDQEGFIMKWFANLSTKGKLIFGFGFMWLMLAFVALEAYGAIEGMTRSARDMHDLHYVASLDLVEFRANMNYNRAQTLTMMLMPDKATQAAIVQDIQDRARSSNAILSELFELASDSGVRRQLTEFDETRKLYQQTREEVFSLIQSGKVEEAIRLNNEVQEERFAKMRSIDLALAAAASKDMNTQMAADALAAQWTIGILVLAGAAAFVLGMLQVIALNRFIAMPLRALSKTAELIAAGDLSLESPSAPRKDEVGVLTHSFSLMSASLRSMADLAERIAAGDLTVAVAPKSDKDLMGSSLARMVESLRRSTADIAEAIGLLGSTASEILASTTQVASGTAETSSAISQTTVTVEEVRQAARLSSDKAKNVSDNARRVSETSQSGQKAVEEAAAGMIRIRDQMESIAQTIVRLSEQGQSIGEIIASVTDFADQSNLLAVNAAIEAARAGEQGRGFVVVAQEIRSLAEQSKQATAKVREILSELQKATGAAVMATEQGGKAVEAGVRQSTQAGEAIRALTDGTAEAAQAAIQIVASSQQQVIGMDQIGIAMENINQAGTQTASSMRQAETAAQNLHELGRKLKALVEQYRT